MADKKAKRERGRILTESGWNKLDAALQAWEILPGNKRTFERIGHEAQLDPGTVAKIFKRREGSDLNKLEQLFRAFQIKLDESDHGAVPPTTANADPNFVGREGAIADLTTLINRNTKFIVIQARGGVGKTTLARKYLQQEFDSFLEFPIAKETKDIASIESLIEEKLRQLGEEPGREFLVSIDRLKRKLQTERIGILIDNLEPALDSAGKFIEPHRRYVELLRVLADPSVQSVTLITSRERLNEYSVSVQHYLLGELSLDAWTQFFHNRFAIAEPKPFSDEDQTALATLHNAYGGNAKAMDILCGAILTDYSGNISAYWHANQNDLLIERPLEDLVVSQFDRLQQLDPDAYNLLCRMGCYRYQDVPTVPLEGLLCLLWDVPENRQRRVIKTLQERSLIEHKENNYWLHPVIRNQSIDQLRNHKEWITTNNHAAEFLTGSVRKILSVKDALKAFEAHYHYLNISDFKEAANVILKERASISCPSERLGRSFFKLGLYQQMISTITLIIKNTDSDYHLSGLYDILGILFRMSGKIKEAIEFHKMATKFANDFLSRSEICQDLNIEDTGVRSWEIHSLLNIGICNLYLCEIEEAKIFFEKTRSFGLKNPYILTSTAFLAFVNSCLGFSNEAFNLLCEIESNLGYGLNATYKLVIMAETYKNLGEFEKAHMIYSQTIQNAKVQYYTSIQSKALCGLAELYRIYGDFNEALSRQMEAVDMISKNGTRSDLAETYYQIGLTYQAMGELKKSDEKFCEAIQLFNEMNAPKQVERVRRSMEQGG